MGYTSKDANLYVSTIFNSMTQELQNGKSIVIQGFGSFEVKKKMERISVNPTTGKRYLIPPKLVLAFKQSNVLKEMFNAE
jgi:DNA-binding protein HU-beta